MCIINFGPIYSITKMKEDAKSISWRVEFSGKKDPHEIYLLMGIDDVDNPYSCQLITSTESKSVAECTYFIPPVTSAPYFEVTQLYVDGEVADMPEIQRVELELRPGIRFIFSDLRTWVSNRYQIDGKAYLDISTQGPDPVTTIIVRCQEEEMNAASRIVEQFYLRDKLPIKAQSGINSTFQIACNSDRGKIVEVIVTDLSGYPARPHLK